MFKYRYLAFFDTEFVSSKKGSQPIQVAFSLYKFENNDLILQSSFNEYISLMKGVRLNRYVSDYTGITSKTLSSQGINIRLCQKKFKKYLKSFDKKNTLCIGWEIYNDLFMLNMIAKSRFPHLNIYKYNFADLSKANNAINKLDKSIKLKCACDNYGVKDIKYHNADNDVLNTAKLFLKMYKKHEDDLLNNLKLRTKKLK